MTILKGTINKAPTKITGAVSFQVIDQEYNPESANAQSGKAVAQAVAGKADKIYVDNAIGKCVSDINALTIKSAKLESELATLRAAQAQMSGDTRINLNGTGKITAVPKNAAVLGVGGKIKGMTITPLVAQASVAVGGTVSFSSVSGNKYYDSLHKTILTGTGSTMTITNDTTAVANINVIDLNAHGLQSKTATEIAQICPNYISGTQSVTPMRVKSIGKNIFNIDKPLKYYKANIDKNYPLKIENGIIYSAGKHGNTRGEGVYVEINGLPVTISFDAEWSSDTSDTKFCRTILFNELASDRVIIFDFKDDSSSRTIQEKNVITIPANNYKYVGISFWGIEPYKVRIKNLQIEYGTGATEYELYKETTCYIEPKPLRRLPNGVCDTVDLATGKRTINVKEYTLQESDIQSIYTGMTSFDIAEIKKPNDFIGFGSMTQTLNFSIEGYKTTPVILNGNPIYLNCVTAYWNNSQFALALNKGVTLAQAREMLVGKKLYYQLATPITENNVVTGTLLSYPKGLIICEPAIADAGVYDDGITILRTDYPIQSLETLCKVNADGTQTPLDVSAATITDAGTKITHPALFNGDIVAFTYFTASSGIIGENVYNYVNANGLTLGADGKYYKVGFAIDASGNISLTKTEVV